MPDAEYVGGNTNEGYQTQDIIRTVNISFQPYMPFTQTYAMGLQDTPAGTDANYFRVGPPSIDKTKGMSQTSDSSYPFKDRRHLFGGETGAFTGKITNVAKNKDRIGDMMDAYRSTNAQGETNEIANELATLLNSSYAFDRGAFLRRYVSPTSQRNIHEIEVSMLSEALDAEFGKEQSRYEGEGLRDKSDIIFTKHINQTFDILMTENTRMASYIDHLYGREVSRNMIGLEISKGKGAKPFFDIPDIEDMNDTEAINALVNKINTKIDDYNIFIKTNIGPQLKFLRDAGVAPEAQQSFILEAARESAPAGQDSKTDAYMVRQIMARLLENNFKAYPFLGQVSTDSFASTLILPHFVNNVPQLQHVTVDDVVHVRGAGDVFIGLQTYAQDVLGMAAGDVTAIVSRIQSVSSQRGFASSVFETVGNYTSAATDLMADNSLDVTIGGQGLGSIHRVSFDIATTLRREIEAHYGSRPMQNAFSQFYERMMKKANSITNLWYTQAKSKVGMRDKPISEEWRSPSKGWSGGQGRKKSGIGVWSSPRYAAWKNGNGTNFTISPFLEARRMGTGGGAVASRFTNNYNNPL
jgi:hypothetical protein